MSRNLEVDVNGHETFFVKEKVVTSFSGRFRKLFEKSTRQGLKVIFHEFPGGAEGFELIVRFCYNGGRIGITPSNVLLLHSAANFVEINDLIDQTKVFLESIHQWTWFELIDCLKKFQELVPSTNSSCMLQKILNCFIGRFFSPRVSSPCASSSSSESSSVQLSGEISTYSSQLSSSLSTIWFRDLEFLSVDLFEKVAKTMILMKLDHETISSFLNYYQRMKFRSLSSSGKCKFIVIVINLLCSLDGSFFSFKSLCNMLQVSFTLKITKSSTKKLECLIGSRLDEATLDDLLVPSPPKKSHAYYVNLVLRFLKTFLEDSTKHLVLRRLNKVAHLMDLYIAEVAPDPHLKPSKFRALVFSLPDFARDSHDRIYEAMDMYFRAHNYLYEEEKIKICRALNYDKLSSDSLIHLSQNAKFPAKVKGQFGMNMQKVKKCRKRQIKAANAKKFDVNCSNSGRSLPRLCS
ncbi:BTB/POZ domain-containing protein [Forsythia ovata]|uniref:BTB/POZ domain-containing protein n=1 Tax=Forsythia ovata TaxID=205694 RepID=A0ABD1V0U7_9LAMI